MNRQYWTTEETRALLTVWAEESVQRRIDGVCRNEDVMEYMVAKLKKMGIQRTTLQVREKLKKLRAQYKLIKAHNGRIGMPKKSFPWFKLIDSVLGHQPAVVGETTEEARSMDTISVDVIDVLPAPWREVSWTDTTRESLRQDFISYKMPSRYPVSHIKALLLGPMGSGKSCFVNSVKSTMYKRIVHLPNVGTAVNGFTKKLTVYDIHGGKGDSPTVLSLCDVMGVGNDDSTGLSISDTLAVIKGHIPKGYKFQPDVPITDAVSGYKVNPSPNEQVHCVLFVLDAYKLTSYPSSLKSTLRKLHTTISDLGIPQLILLTHVDQVCPLVQEDLKYIYCSQTVQDKMQKAAELVGLPLSYVLPMTNYVSQLTVDCNTDILLLSVVMSILQAVDDTLEDQYPCTTTASHTPTASLYNEPVDLYNL